MYKISIYSKLLLFGENIRVNSKIEKIIYNIKSIQLVYILFISVLSYIDRFSVL